MEFEELKKRIDSGEFDTIGEDFYIKYENQAKIRNSQLKRFHNCSNKVDFIERVIIKYNSDKYKNRWYNKNIEPPYDLYWLLFDYAIEYGRIATFNEYQKYSNFFVNSMYVVNGYGFMRMDGQGSVIKVIKL
jgi:hypothetical protein